MDSGSVNLSGVSWTMLVTLYLRALDSRSAQSLLEDHYASSTIDRLDYDFNSPSMQVSRLYAPLVALRAWALDQMCRDFVLAHPDATVLHLGCGLDSRVCRVGLPAAGEWFDVDLPSVMALRDQFFEPSERYHQISGSVLDPTWWQDIPTDRPTLVVAEGLLMYFSADQVQELLQRISARFGTGEILFDLLHPALVRSTHFLPGPYSGFRMAWGVRSGHQIEALCPQLRMIQARDVLGLAPSLPTAWRRRVWTTVAGLPYASRRWQVFRFGF